MLRFPEKFRIAGDSGGDGAFRVKLRNYGELLVIATGGLGWEHVSVSRRDRCPVWEEMCEIKALFFDAEDAVMQLHPPESTYVNNHPFCLHLWRPTEGEIPLPDPILVGFNELGVLK